MKISLIAGCLLAGTAWIFCAQSSQTTGTAGGQNLAVHLHGAALAGLPVDLMLVAALDGTAAASFPVGERAYPNSTGGIVHNRLMGYASVSLSLPDPATKADPGSYLVQYSLTTTYPLARQLHDGVLGAIGIQSYGASGFVLLKPGQSVSVGDSPGLGSLELTLSP